MRGKNKLQCDNSSTELYKAYIETLVDDKSSYRQSKSDFTNILRDTNRKIINLIIENNFDFKLPARLGNLKITKKKLKFKLKEDGTLNTRYLPCNYKETRELWLKDPEAKQNRQLVFHTNEHTEGFKLNFHWSKKTANVRNVSVIQFIACREAKRLIPKKIKENPHINYFER